MAARGGGRGGLGWAILAAALAVPGFLFYNWWSHLKAEREHAISAKASKRADGGVFQTPPPQAGRLINPIASSTSAPAASPPAAAALPPMPARTAPVGTMPAGTATPATSAGMIAGASSPRTAPAVLLSSTSTIVLARDPMMSPMDVVRLQEAEQAEADRLRALEEANRPRPSRRARKRYQPPIESRIELQGIVAKSDGDNLAIINGSTVNPGESFTVSNYSGKVKVVRITSSVVTLDYKGRKIKLSVNAD